jgi:hypothetical protein
VCLLNSVKSIRRADLGIIIVLAVCLLAAYPYLSRPSLPLETDAELHVIRTAELSRLLRAGEFYPRWAPDFYYGYGYPIFNYYAPLSYFVAAGLTLVPGVDVVLAVKIVFIVGLLAAGLGMYVLVRVQWGERSGIVAAAAYVYAPYVQYIDPYARGVLAESVGLALFPWVMWAFLALFSSVAERPGMPRRATWWWRLPLAAALLSALICAHNLLGLVSCTILGAWICWGWIVWLVTRHRHLPLNESRAGDPRSLVRVAAAVGLGVALSAFFWLPVVLERDAVQYTNLVSVGGHYDFRNHFLSLSELLRPTLRLDLGATEPAYLFNLGTVQWITGFLGALSLLAPGTRARSSGLFWALAALALTILMLPISSVVWETVPLMPFLQFPWRLLGPLAACLAVLSGVAVASLEALGTPRLTTWAAAGILGLILILAVPLTYPPEWPAEFGATDPWGILQRELEGRWLGTTSTGDYVPAGVAVVPRPNSQVVESYRAGGLPDRVNRATLPAGTTVTLDPAQDRPLIWSYQIHGRSPFVFRLFQFYFPGWTATLDGRPVPIELAKPEGFITVDVPSGSHRLVVAFGDTPVRAVAWMVSGAALMISLILVSRARPSPVRSAGTSSAISPLFLLVPAAVWLFKLALADPLGWFRLQSEGLTVLGAERHVYYQVGEQIALIGFDWEPAEPGETAELTLYWKALRPVPTNYQVFVHLRDHAGAVVAQSDRLNPGDYPTEWWPLTKYVRDEHRLEIPAELPAGVYDLAVGLWTMGEGVRLPVADGDGQPVGDSIFLERLAVQ